MLARSFAYLLIWVNLGAFLTGDGIAQELEPRAQASAPVRLNILILGYAYSSGNVLLDQALPIEGAKTKVNSLTFAYASTINLFGRLTKLDVVIPFSHGNWEGFELGLPVSVNRTGFGDPLVRLGVNFIGAPALYGREYAGFNEKFVAGASFQMRIPLGQYEANRIVNLGTNRWAFKPNIGAAMNLGKWVIETSIGAWFFTRNDDFFGGNSLWQRPLYSLQAHVAYKFRRGFWLAASYAIGRGGETLLNDEEMGNYQKNSRFGLTFAIPIASGHAVTLSYATGITTRYGADFDTVACAYQYRWSGRLGR